MSRTIEIPPDLFRPNLVEEIACNKCREQSVACLYWDSGGESQYFLDNFRHVCLNPVCDYQEERLDHYGGVSPNEYEWPTCPFCARGAMAGSAFPPTAARIYSKPRFERVCELVIIDFEQISLELYEYFASHPHELQRLHWRKLEVLLDAIFRNQGFQTELGPGGNDQGVDLRLIKKDSIGDLLTLVQVKRYSLSRPIALEAVAALGATVDDQRANRGLFVTTSRYLPSARRFAERQGARLVLAAPEDVARWCADVAKRS